VAPKVRTPFPSSVSVGSTFCSQLDIMDGVKICSFGVAAEFLGLKGLRQGLDPHRNYHLSHSESLALQSGQCSLEIPDAHLCITLGTTERLATTKRNNDQSWFITNTINCFQDFVLFEVIGLKTRSNDLSCRGSWYGTRSLVRRRSLP